MERERYLFFIFFIMFIFMCFVPFAKWIFLGSVLIVVFYFYRQYKIKGNLWE